MAETSRRTAGRLPGFTREHREAFLQAFRDGLPLVTCCTAGGIEVKTYLEWVQIGEGRFTGDRQVSERRQVEAGEFAAQVREAKEVREHIELDNARLTIARAVSEGFMKVRIRRTTRPDGTVETIEDVEKGTPQWTAAAWTRERFEPERCGRIDRGEAIALKKREAVGEVVVDKEQAKAQARELLSMFSPADLREIVRGLPIDADEQEPGAE